MTRADRLRKAVMAPLLAFSLAVVSTPRAFALDPALDVTQYAHTAWFFREGFAQGRVNAMAQTPDGYLWLGTEFGLLRFDGVRSVPWRPPGNARLPSDWIRTLLTAPDGTLWIGTLRGLASWKDGTLTQYPELAGQSVNTIVVDREGTTWAGGYASGTGQLQTSAGTLCAITSGHARCHDEGFGEWVGSLHEDRSGALWVTAQTGLWRWRPGQPRQYAASGSVVASSQALHETEEGHLLIAGEEGLEQIAGGKVLAYPLRGNRATARPERLLRDRDGGLWIGTFEGLVHVHRGRTDVYTQANGLSGDFITRLFEDREGNIWVATKNGVDRFRDLAVRTISTNQGLQSAAPWSVLAARDGSVWLGTVDGLSRWRDGVVTTYRTPRTGATPQEGRARRRSGVEILDSGLPDDGAGTLFEDDAGRLWVSTLRGVAYFEDGRFVPADQLPAGRTSLIAGRAGNVWIANDAGGLYRMRGGTVAEHRSWTALGLDTPPTALLPDPARSGLWMGLQGRVVFVEDGAVRASFSAADGLAEGVVNDLRIDEDGALWAATAGGLSHIKDGRVVTLTSRDGLPCDAVHWSVEGGEGAAWLYTTCGLVRVAAAQLRAAVSGQAERLETTVFNASDGVALRATPSLYRPQVARTADGGFWFLPGDGVSVLEPRRLAINALPPSVHIEHVTADRTAYDVVSGLRLPALVRDLEIDYTALSLVAPEKNRFRVKLEGRDTDWLDVGNRRQAHYADLAPGTYRFRVTASNNSGVWNESGAVMEFSIAPAYYQTAWFRGTAVATFLGLIWAGYQLHLRRIGRDVNLRMDERLYERTRIARELHDTLLQSFQGSVLRVQSARDLLPANPEAAVAALDGALDRADQAIIEGRDAIHNLRASTSTANELAESIVTLAEDLGGSREGEGGATFRLSVEGAPRTLHAIVRDDVHRIAREALRNAFRHADADHIEAEITYAAGELRVRVRDDGRGIDPEQLSAGRGRHWGVTSMRERAAQIGAQIHLWSERGAGTEVELRVPGSLAYAALRHPGLFRWGRTLRGEP